MNGLARRMLVWGLVAPLAVLATSAGARQEGRTADGWPYVSGGVPHEDLLALHAQRDAFSLWVVTAAKKTGAFLADVRVTVRDERQRVVFDGALDGPWLFIDLPPGRYDVQAGRGPERLRRSSSIHPGDHHQLVFYFDTDDELGPDRPVSPGLRGAERPR